MVKNFPGNKSTFENDLQICRNSIFLVSRSWQISGFGHLTKRFSLTNNIASFIMFWSSRSKECNSLRVSSKQLSYSFWISRPQLSKDKLKWWCIWPEEFPEFSKQKFQENEKGHSRAQLSEKNLWASWHPSFHFLSPEQLVFWSPKIIFKN